MTQKEKMKLVLEYEDKILELIDNQEDFTRSDLQGVAQGIIHTLIQKIEIITKEENLKINTYAITSPKNYIKYVNEGDNKYLNDIDIEKVKVGDSIVVAYEGGEKEIKIGRII